MASTKNDFMHWDDKKAINMILLSGAHLAFHCSNCMKVSYLGPDGLARLYHRDAVQQPCISGEVICRYCNKPSVYSFHFSECEDRFSTRFWLNQLDKSFGNNIPRLLLQFLPELEATNVFTVSRTGDYFQRFELLSLGQIRNPSLMLSRLDLAQLGANNADIAFDLLKEGKRMVQHRNAIVVSDRHEFKGVFGPAIDTVFLSECVFHSLLRPLQAKVKEYLVQLKGKTLDKTIRRFALFNGEFRAAYQDESLLGRGVFTLPPLFTCIDRGLYYVVSPTLIPHAVAPFRRVLEIGTGSGLLAKMLIHNLPCLESIVATDIDIQAIRCAHANIDCILWEGTMPVHEHWIAWESIDPSGPLQPKVTFVLGQDLDVLEPGTFDLIVINPPYVPSPQRVRQSAIAGTELMHDVLTHHANRLLSENGLMFMIYSALAEEQFQEYVAESPLRVSSEIVRRVRLDLPEIIENSEWTEYLERHCGLERQDTDDGAIYWHDVKVVLLERPDRRAKYSGGSQN